MSMSTINSESMKRQFILNQRTTDHTSTLPVNVQSRQSQLSFTEHIRYRQTGTTSP